MNKIIKLCALSGLLLLAVLATTACSGNWDPPYEDLNENGYTVSVRFDANGGVFAGTKDVYIVDVFDIADASSEKGVYLLAPEDPLRAEGAFEISRNGYFLAGWYTERTPRVNKNGQALDDYGVPTSESGRQQGYSYNCRWDFNTNTLSVENSASFDSSEPYVTLYAAWIPYFTYEFYAEGDNGDFNLVDSFTGIDLEIPEWNANTGKLDTKSFPQRDGYTFDAAFLDAEKTIPLTEKLSGASEYVDYKTGTTSTEKISIFSTWLDGNWYKIYNAKQFYNNSRLDGNYILCNDIDFTDEVWSPTLAKGKFIGKIYGNGYKISGVNVIQADNSQLFGGLFGSIDQGAVFENVVFENVSYEINAGSRMQGATFGLLAGTISSDAVFTNVSVSGKLIIGKDCYPQTGYVIGLLCSAGGHDGVDISNITCAAAENAENITVETEDNGTVTVTFN